MTVPIVELRARRRLMMLTSSQRAAALMSVGCASGFEANIRQARAAGSGLREAGSADVNIRLSVRSGLVDVHQIQKYALVVDTQKV